MAMLTAVNKCRLPKEYIKCAEFCYEYRICLPKSTKQSKQQSVLPSPRSLPPPPGSLTPSPRSLTPPPRSLHPPPKSLPPAPRSLTPSKKKAVEVGLDELCVGLLNKSGGIIALIIRNEEGDIVSSSVFENWQMTHSQRFINHVLNPDQYLQCFDFREIDRIRYMIITPSDPLVTLRSHLNVRIGSQKMLVYDAKTIAKILKSCGGCLPEKLEIPNRVGAAVKLSEEASVEFKKWNTLSIDHFLKDERLVPTLLAFPNLTEGGSVVFGVSDAQVVVGHKLEESDEEEFTSFIDKLMKEDLNTGRKHVWGNKENIPKQGVDWDIDFIPLEKETTSKESHDDRLVLILIRVRKFPGGVFIEEPESYTLSDDGLLETMSFCDWKKRLPSIHISTEPDNKQLQRKVKPQKAKKKATANKGPEPPTVESESEACITSERLDAVLQTHEQLSWIQHQKDWATRLTPVTRHIESCILELSTSPILQPADPVKFFPPRNCLQHVCSEEQIDQIVASIPPGTASVAFATRRWVSYLPGTYSLEPPPGHLMDMLLMTSPKEHTEPNSMSYNQPTVHLWTISTESEAIPDLEVRKGYMYETGRLVKMHFVLALRKLNIPLSGFVICCHLLQGSKLVSYNHLEQMVESVAHTKLSLEFQSLQKAASCMFVSQKNAIKDRLGNERLVQLTSEQMAGMLQSTCQFNFIEGPPGSGKTFMALYLKLIYDLLDMAWIVTTTGYAKFLQYQGLDNVHVVLNDADLENLIKDGKLDEKTCVVVDDVQNTNFHPDTWKHLIEVIKDQHCDLYVFGDNEVQNYKWNVSFVKQLFSVLPSAHIQTLREVHRNSRKVVSFLQTCTSKSDKLWCSHNMAGDDIEVIRVQNIEEDNETNELIQLLKRLTDPDILLAAAPGVYSPTDIALLVEEEKIETIIALIKSWLGVEAHRVKFPVRGVIVDTVDNFLGLECNVCIFCIPELQLDGNATFLNRKFRAFIASRAIFRLIFIHQSPITSRITNLLQFENIDSIVDNFKGEASLLWEKTVSEEGGLVHDVSWLMSGSSLGILYTATRGNPNLNLLDHEDGAPLPFPLDTSYLDYVYYASSTRDMASVVLVGKDGLEDVWSVHNLDPDSGVWSSHSHHYRIPVYPEGVTWTPNGRVVLVNREGVLFLHRADGELVWSRNPEETQLTRHPGRVATCGQGRTYVTDRGCNCVRVYNSQGQHSHTLPPHPDQDNVNYPYAVCVTPGGTVFVAHLREGEATVSVCLSGEDRFRALVRNIPGKVYSLSVSGDLLAVGCDEACLRLYKIS